MQRGAAELGGLDDVVACLETTEDPLGVAMCEALLYTVQAVVEGQLPVRLWLVTIPLLRQGGTPTGG